MTYFSAHTMVVEDNVLDSLIIHVVTTSGQSLIICHVVEFFSSLLGDTGVWSLYLSLYMRQL